MADQSRSFTSTLGFGPKRRIFIPVPFDPNEVWGTKTEHHVSGTVDGRDVRAVIEPMSDGYGIALGPTWRRDRGIEVGAAVSVVLAPEGVQRQALAPDLRNALDEHPGAAAFFDGLAQFYTTAYVRWIDATKRRPEERDRRIREVVSLLAAGVKQRPRPARARDEHPAAAADSTVAAAREARES